MPLLKGREPMTKPKSTRKGRSAPTIAERARAIVNNPGRYDEETRHAINNMLRENSKDLADFVRRAESGEEIFDLVHPLQTSPPPEHPLSRMRRSLETPFNYRQISEAEVERLTDKILDYDDDEQTWAFIALINGMTGAHYAERAGARPSVERPCVEGIAITATHRAFTKTGLFNEGLREFASLNPENPFDARVLGRKYIDEGEA
jgi:hypothetical protein